MSFQNMNTEHLTLNLRLYCVGVGVGVCVLPTKGSKPYMYLLVFLGYSTLPLFLFSAPHE